MATVDIAALLALSSSLCIAVGDVLQQGAAHRITDRTVGQIELVAKLLRDQRWWWGSVLLVASLGLQAAALGQGSVLLVQPLLMFSLLIALPINARSAHRRVSGREWLWAGTLTTAVIFFVTVGNPEAGRSNAPPHTWAVVAVVFVPLLLGCVVAAKIWGGAVAAVLLAFASGSLWGVFAVLTKEIVHRLGEGPGALVRTPELYAGLLAALGGLVWSQAAFRAGPLTASMPTLQVSQPVVGALLGVVVLGETLNTGRSGLVVLAVAAVAMIPSIIELARVEAATTRNRVDEQLRGARRRTGGASPTAVHQGGAPR